MKKTSAILESYRGEEQSNDGQNSWRSWILCLCVMCNLSITCGLLIGCSSVLFVALLEEFKQTKEATAWVGSISNAMIAIPGPLAASLANRYGYRKVAMCGAAFFVTGLFTSSFSPNLPVLCLSFSVVGGVGGGMMFNVSYSANAKVFETRRSLAIGLASCGLSFGYITMPPLCRYLIGSFGLWNTFRIFAGICSSCFCFSVFYPSDSSTSNCVEGKSSFSLVLSVLKTPSFRYVTIFHSIAFLGFYIPFQHAVRHAEEQGVPKEKTTFFITYFGITTCLSRLVLSKIVDIFKHVEFLLLYLSQTCIVLLGLASISVGHMTSYYAFLGYFLLYGLLDAGFISQQCSIVFQCVGQERLSMAWGIFTLCFSGAVMTGPPIAGYLGDVYKSYQPPFYFAGTMLLIAGAGFSLIPRQLRKEKKLRKTRVELYFCENDLVVVDKVTSL